MLFNDILSYCFINIMFLLLLSSLLQVLLMLSFHSVFESSGGP